MPRWLEIFIAGAALVLALPLFLLLTVAILMKDGAPVFFVQERVGKDGRPFRLLKFRTMRVTSGAEVTVSGDPRITPLGNLLRRSKLDELPQLVNVFKGDMSFVGPRPEIADFVALYTPEQREVLSVRPGITDPASIEFRDESEILARAADWRETYVREVLPRKLGLSRAYLRRRTFFKDIGVIFKTLEVVLRGSGK
jgi:lipopolysaccharide/colanic/teichoic acid biosynthesis glycosyltransferase